MNIHFTNASNCSTWTAATGNGLTFMAWRFTHTMTGVPLKRVGASVRPYST